MDLLTNGERTKLRHREGTVKNMKVSISDLDLLSVAPDSEVVKRFRFLEANGKVPKFDCDRLNIARSPGEIVLHFYNRLSIVHFEMASATNSVMNNACFRDN